ncbi:MAG TPA: winged helix-turn-helix domain-containing protein [Vicinamibacterales bacterium]|nr:winged helix-turn-helix domain-containing protein [Vicinamibacterales bacterium]
MVNASSPFGGQTRTRVLLALRLLEESYPRELARVLGVSLNGVQSAISGLERDGLVASRAAGRTRLVRLNPRYFARQELQQYLLKLAAPDRDLQARTATLRRRPRRTGKPA